LDALSDSILQAIYTPNIHRSDAEDFGALPGRGDVFRHSLGLFDLSSYDAGIGAEVDECSDLGAAYGA